MKNKSDIQKIIDGINADLQHTQNKKEIVKLNRKKLVMNTYLTMFDFIPNFGESYLLDEKRKAETAISEMNSYSPQEATKRDNKGFTINPNKAKIEIRERQIKHIDFLLY